MKASDGYLIKLFNTTSLQENKTYACIPTFIYYIYLILYMFIQGTV